VHQPSLSRFVAATCAAGFAVLAITVVFDGQAILEGADARFWLFVAAILVAELFPIDVPGHEGEVTFSLPFALSLLLIDGGPAVLLVHAMAVGIAEAVRRRPVDRLVFNVAQYALSWGAASQALLVLGTDLSPGGDGLQYLTAAGVAALAGAALVFVVVNTVLASTAPALARGERPFRFLRADLGAEIPTTAVLTALVPIVLVVADARLLLLPLFAIPLAAIHRGGQQAAVNDYQARHDALTGLPNRVELGRVLRARLEHPYEDDSRIAVLLLDLDGFQEINDSLGHDHGDLVIEHVAARLRGAVPSPGVVARFGGDEFALVLGSLDGRRSPQEAAAELLDVLREPVAVGHVALDVRASIGIAWAPEHGDRPEDLLRRADAAMHQAKTRRLGWAVHDPRSEQPGVERLALATQLRHGIEHGELELHYQPKVELRTGRTTSVEALVRWRHPHRGLLGPDHFIELAEHTGLIHPLTTWVLDEAVQQAKRWRAAGLGLSVAVNLSVRSITPDLPDRLAELLRDEPHPASLLELEITESTMASPEETLAVLAAVNGLGVPLAVDDYGTGYSSLAYLKQLPVRTIKIDRSFVMSMGRDRSDRAIVHSTIDLARQLTLEVVAEGVETSEAVATLQALGCDYAQGFHLSRPLPAAELEGWLRTSGRDPLPAAPAN
jgi:diguanylate cyclase (GGDEF)-like protein